MIFGFNTDVRGMDATYHVQTEDRGPKNPVIDSIIYVGGEIVDRVRTPYVIEEMTQAQIEAMVHNQHRELVESIRSGVLAPTLPHAASVPPSPGYAIRLLNQQDIVRDDHLCFEFSVWNRMEGRPAQGASLDLRWIPAGCVAQNAALRTGEDGKAVVSFPIPEGNPEITLLVCAKGPEEQELVKFQIRSKAGGTSA